MTHATSVLISSGVLISWVQTQIKAFWEANVVAFIELSSFQGVLIRGIPSRCNPPQSMCIGYSNRPQVLFTFVAGASSSKESQELLFLPLTSPSPPLAVVTFSGGRSSKSVPEMNVVCFYLCLKTLLYLHSYSFLLAYRLQKAEVNHQKGPCVRARRGSRILFSAQHYLSSASFIAHAHARVVIHEIVK